MKQARLAFIIIRPICPVISFSLAGHMVFHTPTPMANVDRLEKPLKAYVAIAADLSYNNQ